jgi:hypothetical protein
MNANELVASIEKQLRAAEDETATNKANARRILDAARSQGRDDLTASESADVDRAIARAEAAVARRSSLEGQLTRAKDVAADEERLIRQSAEVRTTSAGKRMPAYDAVLRIGDEPRTYTREQDERGDGTPFLTDVVSAFRGNPGANERLARHAREYEVDNKGRKTRAAGDVTTGAFPNLIIPAYITDEYAAKPSNARPFADVCRHVDLPPEGMKVEIAKGNTTSTAALQTSELVTAGGGNFDADPLELLVQTAEAWQLVSRQALDRGRVTESVVMNDMLDQMNALIDATLITQTTTGLYDSGTRITYDSASPTVAELYPYILQGASKVSQALLNRGAPTHVIMHPRRWFWLQSLFSSTWPMFSQPGVPAQMAGSNTANAYANGVAGVLPCGLQVVMDANVPTAALAGAQTGGTQDILFVVPQHECVLFEPTNREVFIRAEAPAASQLAVMLVIYEYFTFTFQRYAATAFQRINGTGTVPPAGF